MVRGGGPCRDEFPGGLEFDVHAVAEIARNWAGFALDDACVASSDARA